MKYLIITFVIISQILGFTVNSRDKCQCSQLLYPLDCYFHYCNWDRATAKCLRHTCSSLTTQDCDKIRHCYSNGTTCLEKPQSCSDLHYTSKSACEHAGCTYIAGNSCTEFKQHCSQYSTEDCPKLFCSVLEDKCQQSQCSQIETSKCNNFYQYCQLNNNNCVPATCSSLGLSQCKLISSNIIFNPWVEETNFTPCISNGKTCVDAQASDLSTPYLCLEHTFGLYHWSSANETDGSCIPCKEN